MQDFIFSIYGQVALIILGLFSLKVGLQGIRNKEDTFNGVGDNSIGLTISGIVFIIIGLTSLFFF